MSIMNLSYLKGFARAYPFFVPFFSFFFGIVFQNNLSIYFTFLVIIVDVILITSLKNISRYIYNLLNIDRLPILGLGKRPDGAKYCGCFIDENNIDKISTSFGMPSGHSIVAMTTCIFWSRYIMDNYPKSYKRDLSIFLLYSVSLFILFSRIWLGCHTIQQVIIGSFIGSFIGYEGYELYKK